jgi:hypothetical protein
VNGDSLVNAQHDFAVKSLVSAGKDVCLVIKHDKQPAGLRSIVIMKASATEPLGMNICGGIKAPRANPHDPIDEGIFVERVC